MIWNRLVKQKRKVVDVIASNPMSSICVMMCELVGNGAEWDDDISV